MSAPKDTLEAIGNALGSAIVALFFGSPVLLAQLLFHRHDALMRWPLALRGGLVLVVVAVIDFMIHGFKLVWGGDRRATWLLLALTVPSIVAELLSHVEYAWLFAAAPFLILLEWDRRRYSRS